MCTVSWVRSEEGYHLLCNRDEKLTRARAVAPCFQKAGNVHFMAPIDGGAGGTWVASNQFGITICLLNGDVLGAPVPIETRERSTSRGSVPLMLISAKDADEVCRRFAVMDLYDIAPFTLVTLEPGTPAAVMSWNGRTRVVLPSGDFCSPLVSSSVDLPKVQMRRRHAYLQHLDLTAGESQPVTRLLEFHQSHGDQPDAYSPCMHRDDAETVSFTWVSVIPSSALMYYSPAAPCKSQLGTVRALPLVA